MKKIVFDSFLKTPEKITFNVNSYEGNDLIKHDELFFEFSEEVSVNDNLIAIALCTFCKNMADEIYFDLTLHEKTIENISEYTHAKVSSKLLNNEEFINKNNNNISLNFSGGFDSLTAKILLEDLVDLVAINFTGVLKREHDFFKKFKPHTVTTNFRELGYSNEHNDWTFMGVASILYSDFLNLGYQIFGSIFESSPSNGIKEVSLRKKVMFPPFTYAGITDLKVIPCLTNVGTALVLCNTHPYLINDSLVSLSGKGSRKLYVKHLIIRILIKRFNLKNIYLEPVEPPIDIIPWGSNFAVDFLTLYFLKYSGFDEVSKIVNNIPEKVLSFVESHSLEFYEKYDTNFLNNVPENIKVILIKNLTESKIYPFNENDFGELKDVMELLSEYYTI